MNSRRKLILLSVLVIGILALTGLIRQRVAENQVSDSGSVVLTDHYRLAQVVNEPLVVIADTVNMDNASRVGGNAALISRSSAQINGQVSGDLTGMGDSLTMGEDSQVNGDAALMGGKVTVKGRIDGDLTVMGDTLILGSKASVAGEVVACVSQIDGREYLRADQFRRCGESEALAKFGPFHLFRDGLNWGDLAQGMAADSLPVSLFLSAALTGLAALAVTVFPAQFSYIGEAIRTIPRRLIRTGCLTFLAAAGLIAGLVFLLALVPPLGLVLLPIGLLIGLVLLGLLLAGWITLALVTGDWLLRRLTPNRLPPLIAVALGSLTLCALGQVLAFIPFGVIAGLLATISLGSLGLGAALTTRVGTRPLRRSYFVQG